MSYKEEPHELNISISKLKTEYFLMIEESVFSTVTMENVIGSTIEPKIQPRAADLTTRHYYRIQDMSKDASLFINVPYP